MNLVRNVTRVAPNTRVEIKRATRTIVAIAKNDALLYVMKDICVQMPRTNRQRNLHESEYGQKTEKRKYGDERLGTNQFAAFDALSARTAVIGLSLKKTCEFAKTGRTISCSKLIESMGHIIVNDIMTGTKKAELAGLRSIALLRRSC